MTLISNLFPARVTIGEQTIAGARFVLTDDHVFVYTEDGTGIHLSYSESIGSYILPRNSSESTTVVLSSGETWSAVQAGGCGCGSKLKRMDVTQALAEVSA